MQPHRKGGIPFARIRNHDYGIADAHLGVHDFSIRRIKMTQIRSVERTLQKINHALRTLGHNVNRNGRVSLGLPLGAHRASQKVSGGNARSECASRLDYCLSYTLSVLYSLPSTVLPFVFTVATLPSLDTSAVTLPTSFPPLSSVPAIFCACTRFSVTASAPAGVPSAPTPSKLYFTPF